MSPVSQFDLLAASLRAETGDLKAFVDVLASKLVETFPHRVRVERAGRLFGGRQRVKGLSIALGDNHYELECDEGQIKCRRRNVVRGVSLKTEQLSLEQWIDSISEALTQVAAQTESDRVALERLLGG
jgi:hypothetical protein